MCLLNRESFFIVLLQSMQFKYEMILVAEKGLKEIEAKVKKNQDKDYELLRGLHIYSRLVNKERE